MPPLLLPLAGGNSTVVNLGELMMILELHRQGLTVSAIARQLGIDRKTVRRYVARGLAKPVIVSRGVGAAKLVETHECGIVVEPEAQAISLAICQIFSNEREALEMGRRGRAAAATVYGWQNVAGTMAGHYAELIASR